MKNGGVFILLALGAIAFVATRNLKSFGQNLRVSFNRVAINLPKTQAAKYTNLWYDLRLVFINPENVKADIQSLNLDVILGNKRIATINRKSVFTIPAREEVAVDFELSVPSLSLGFQAFDMIKLIREGQSLPPVTIRGFLQTTFGRIPVEETIPMQL